jgi:hypothetical protein
MSRDTVGHMMTEFVGLQLSREELKELHAALIQRAAVEDELRKEKSQEEAEHPLLERIEGLLGESETVLHALDHVIEDELWEYSWYAFTDEWAWYRAKQDVEKELAKKERSETELHRLIEQRYQKNFESYVSEIDMIDSTGSKKKKSPSVQRKHS